MALNPLLSDYFAGFWALFERTIKSFKKRVDLFLDLPIMRPHWDGRQQRLARQESLSKSSKT